MQRKYMTTEDELENGGRRGLLRATEDTRNSSLKDPVSAHREDCSRHGGLGWPEPWEGWHPLKLVRESPDVSANGDGFGSSCTAHPFCLVIEFQLASEEE